MDPLLTVKNLTVEINHQVILENLNFTVNPGETLAVIGPNGAGKTVLFRVLLGLLPYKGVIDWKPDIKIGYVPQRLNVEADLPLTVADFFHLKPVTRNEISRVLEAVNFNPKEILLKKLGTLSGGQLQRVLIAWALVNHPDILLFDEPTTGVDVSAEESIYQLLHRLQEQEKLTMILISHEMQVVYRYATNVLCLNKQGLCFGPPKKALTTQTLSRLFGENVSIYQHHHEH